MSSADEVSGALQPEQSLSKVCNSQKQQGEVMGLTQMQLQDFSVQQMPELG
jgi:hypothetical protein